MFRKIVLFSFLSPTMTSRTIFDAPGSRFAVGSSRKSRIGSWTSVRAIATFCFVPLENVANGRSFFSQRPIIRSNRSMLFRRVTGSIRWSRPTYSRFR